MPLRAAGRDARSAVLAPGSRQLPQSPDLSRRGRPAAGAADVPLRAAAAGHAVHWSRRKRRPVARAVRADRQALSSLPSTAGLRCGHDWAARRPRAASPHSSRRGRRGRFTSRQTRCRERPTGGCWRALRRRASWSTRPSISSSFAAERALPRARRRPTEPRLATRRSPGAAGRDPCRRSERPAKPACRSRRDALRLDDERDDEHRGRSRWRDRVPERVPF